MPTALQHLELLEQRADALISSLRGARQERAAQALKDIYRQRDCVLLSPAIARVVCFVSAVHLAIDELEASQRQVVPRRTAPRTAFRSKFSDGEIIEAVYATRTLAEAGAQLGLGKTAISKRLKHIKLPDRSSNWRDARRLISESRPSNTSPKVSK